MFTEVEGDSPTNSAISSDQTEDGSGAIRVNFTDREVLSSETTAAQIDWGVKPRGGQSQVDFCSCILDTVFNGGALCISKWARKYID